MCANLLGGMNNCENGPGMSRAHRKPWNEDCLETCRIDPRFWNCEASGVGIAILKKVKPAYAI